MNFKHAVAPLAVAMLLIPVQAASAATGAFHGDVTLPGGDAHGITVTEGPHGKLTHFAVGYAWDSYVHEDVFGSGQNVTEINNYTGVNPVSTTSPEPGCNGHEYVATYDHDTNGVSGQPHTVVHHNVDLTFHPSGSGSNFQWCHYEHGPETWYKLTFADGSTLEIYYHTPTYTTEIAIVSGAHTGALMTTGDPDGD